MNYEELKKLILEAEGTCIPQAELENPTSNKFIDETGEVIAKEATSILNDLYKDYEKPDEPYLPTKEKGKASKEWDIFGAAEDRLPFSTELVKRLRKTGLEAYSGATAGEYESCYGKSLASDIVSRGKGVRVYFKMSEGKPVFWDFNFKKSSAAASAGKIDPTTFEGNIIYGLRLVMGSPESAKAYAEKYSKIKKGIDLKPAAMEAGIAVAKAIKSSVGPITPDEIDRASGGVMDVKLSKVYAENGVVSTEPKTDIIVGPYNTTVKKKEGSQYASAQANEACAIMQAAVGPLLSGGETEGLTNFLRQTMLKQTWDEVDSTFEDQKTGLEAAAQKGASHELGLDAPGIPEGYDYKKILQEALPDELRDEIAKEIENSSVPVPKEVQQGKAVSLALQANPERDFTTNPISNAELKEAAKAVRMEIRNLQANSVRAAVEGVSDNTADVIKSDEGRIAILKEAVQGNKKFEGDPKTHAPSRLLVWSIKDPASSDFVTLDDEWFSSHGPGVKIDIRSRGEGRGGRMGVGGKRAEKFKENLQESLVFENVDPALLMYGYLLEGERFDKFKGALKKGAEAVSSFAGKTWDLVKGGVDAVLKGMKEIYNAVKKSLQKIFSKVNKFLSDMAKGAWTKFFTVLGIDPESADIDWGSALAAAGLQEQKEHLTKTPVSYKMLTEMIDDLLSKE